MDISEVITNEIKEKIENYNFRVIPRDKNNDFKRMYRLNDSKIREILMSLTRHDYVNQVTDYDRSEHGYDPLVIFEKDVKLTNINGIDEWVTIYVKIKDVEGERVPVISFHKSEK